MRPQLEALVKRLNDGSSLQLCHPATGTAPAVRAVKAKTAATTNRVQEDNDSDTDGKPYWKMCNGSKPYRKCTTWPSQPTVPIKQTAPRDDGVQACNSCCAAVTRVRLWCDVHYCVVGHSSYVPLGSEVVPKVRCFRPRGSEQRGNGAIWS